jgi:anti-sigma-K factor RskA
MDYSLPERADKLAADYVLGTLRGRARRRFENLLPAHPELRHAVARWHDTLMPLAASVPPLAPGPHVWRRIEDRLFDRPATPVVAAQPVTRRWWHHSGAWRVLGVVAGLAVLLLLALHLTPAAELPPVVVVMSQTSGPPSFVASVAGDGRSLVISPLGGVTVDANHELELWQLTEQGLTRSLGIVSAHRSTEVLRKRLLKDTLGYALSLEPRGGSPSGVPSGQIVSTGRLRGGSTSGAH